MRSTVLLTAVLLAPLAGVGGQAGTHAGLDAAYGQFRAGYAALDPNRVADLYAVDAIYVSGRGAPTLGRAAIAANFTRFFDAVRADGDQLALRFRIVERRVAGDAAWDLGYYHLARVRGGTELPGSVGRFVTGLRRDADGRWRFVVDSFHEADQDAWAAASSGVEP